ncbi:dihydroneopterin aldolase [Alphaproteobacteria bacterium]|nr:dihydroneopterin aldolase [Alphaproteobacteria bacterium]
MSNSYSIFIDKLKIDANIGVHSFEKKTKQEIVISVKLSFANFKSPKSDMLNEVVDYEIILNKIREIVDLGHIDLVETLAEKIANECFKVTDSEQIEIKITKTQAIKDAEGIGVEITKKLKKGL